jgi:hypothetical protein
MQATQYQMLPVPILIACRDFSFDNVCAGASSDIPKVILHLLVLQ